MPLDRRIQSLLDTRGDESNPAEMSILQLRQRARTSVDRWRAAGVRDHDVGSTHDLEVDLGGSPTRLRVYSPLPGSGRPDDGLPVVVYFHGGGWVLGDLDTHDGICRAICHVAEALVIAVEYRLAPEHPYPEPLLDCERAILWSHANTAAMGGDPSAIFVAGDSAGANLAAVCVLRMRDREDVRIEGQILIYPAVDDPLAGHASMEEFKVGHAYGQNYDLLCRMMKCYAANRIPLSHPDFAPNRAASLKGAPPALILTAEYDMLRDEGEAYGEKLQAEGVDAAVQRVLGVNHGFMHLTNYLPATDAAFISIGRWIRDRMTHGKQVTASTARGNTSMARR